MSNSAFTPTILQDFREASVSQSGIVNTTAQTFGGIKTYDPSVAFTPKTGFSTGYQLWKDTSSRLRLNFSGGLLFADDTDGTTYFSVSNSGGLTFGKASGLTGQHTIQGDGTANYTLALTATNASASAGQSNGLAIRAGITSADTPFFVANRAGSVAFGSCNGVGAWTLGDPANTSFPGNNIVGRKDGTSVPSGYVGQEIYGTMVDATFSASDTAVNAGTIVLNKGLYMVYARTRIVPGGSTHTQANMGISTVSAAIEHPYYVSDLSTGITFSRYQQFTRFVRITSDSTTIYVVAYATYTGAAASVAATQGDVYAIRIA